MVRRVSLLCVLLVLGAGISAVEAFPARFLHAYWVDTSNLTLSFQAVEGTFQCSAVYGDICSMGNITMMTNISVEVVNSKGETIFSSAVDPHFAQTVGSTYAAFSNNTLGVALAQVLDGPLPSPSVAPFQVTFANFFNQALRR